MCIFLCCLLAADVAEHVGVDVETDVGDVVDVFAGDEPDDVAYLALGIVPCHAVKSCLVYLFIPRQGGDIVQCRSLGIGEKRADAIVFQSVKFGLIQRLANGERPADVHAKKADIDPGYLLADEHDHLFGQNEFLVQLCYFATEHTKGEGHAGRIHLEWSEYFAELPAGKKIYELHHEAIGLFDRCEESIHCRVFSCEVFLNYNYMTNGGGGIGQDCNKIA